MNVLPIGGKQRPPTNQPPHDGKNSLQNGEPKRNHGNCNRNGRWCFLSAVQGQSAKHESYEETAAITEKDGCGIEVKTKEAENCACQSQRHQCNQCRMAKQ